MKTVPIFVSYPHKDRRLVQGIMDEFRDHAGCCTQYQFDIWMDERIACGTPWDASIKAALNHAQVGLLFVSPAYQCSSYIKTIEEPALLAKKCLAVGTRPICFKTQLDPTLGALQFLRLRTPGGKELFFSECITRRQRDAFVQELYRQVLNRL